MLNTISYVWNLHLFTIEGSAISLGHVILGIAVLVIGHYASAWASGAVNRRVLSRFKFAPSVRYMLERITRYFFNILVVLLALKMISIPLTIFTLVGGTIAIGIGFGSQNIMNNFISGLIVMVEQPIRVSDWVEIDGIFGQVEHIGGRSTILRTLDNKQQIVPNSFFLEKMCANWTLDDSVIRSKLSVGVAYGSSPKEVSDFLMQAAGMHPDILPKPAPAVVFQDFAENSMNFDLYFSVRYGAVGALGTEIYPGKVASDLRFRIDELFKHHGIQIPFPQREVVLHMAKSSSTLGASSGGAASSGAGTSENRL